MAEGACKKDIGREERHFLKPFFHNLHYLYIKVPFFPNQVYFKTNKKKTYCRRKDKNAERTLSLKT